MTDQWNTQNTVMVICTFIHTCVDIVCLSYRWVGRVRNSVFQNVEHAVSKLIELLIPGLNSVYCSQVDLST